MQKTICILIKLLEINMANLRPNKKHLNFFKILEFKKKNYLKKLFLSRLRVFVALIDKGWEAIAFTEGDLLLI